MKRRQFIAAAAAVAAAPAWALPEMQQARVETLPADIGGPRVRIWLPPGHGAGSPARRTLYMLDGQFAFSGDSDGQNFDADRRIARLCAHGTIPPTAIVAIDNLEVDRFLQYMPQTIYETAGEGVRETVEREIERTGGRPLVSAEFLDFLTSRLKPFVEARYGTSPDRLDSAIFGASMAGVMAGAIFVEGRQSFGLGACMSPNWAIYDQRMIDHPGLPELWANYFANLDPPERRRLWLDHGTRMMDAGMVPHQRAIADRLAEAGWQRGCNLQTRVYEAGHAYAETAVQMDEILAWLLA